jgi:hypothetical protein
MKRLALFWGLLLTSFSAVSAVLLEGDWESAPLGILTNSSFSSNQYFTSAYYDHFSVNQAVWGSGGLDPNQLNKFTVVSNPVRNGSKAMRIQGCDTSATCPQSTYDAPRGAERKELIFGDINSQTRTVAKYNQTRWFAWSILMPTDNQYQIGDTYSAVTGWVTHFQLGGKVASTGQLFLALNFYPQATTWKVDLGGYGSTKWFGDMQKGVWHDFVVKYHPHYTAGLGHVVVKYRKAGGTFTTVLDTTEKNTGLWPGVTGTDILYNIGNGVYRASQEGDQVIYYDGPWVGETEADVLGFFADAPTQTPLATPTAVNIAW